MLSRIKKFRLSVFCLTTVSITMGPSRTALAQCEGWSGAQGYAGVSSSCFASIMWDQDGLGPLSSKLVVAGSFPVAGKIQANSLATYATDTHEWSSLSFPSAYQLNVLAVLPNNDLVVGGGFPAIGGTSANIGRLHDSQWFPLGSGVNGPVRALLTLPNGDLIVGGDFTRAGSVLQTSRIARWNGTTWSAIGTGTNGPVSALLALPNGDIVAGGAFVTAGGVTCRGIARWNGSAWSAYETGVSGGQATVNSLALLPGGDLVIGGSFTAAGAQPASCIARWDGTTWSALSSGVENGLNLTEVDAILAMPDGTLLAGGDFHRAGGVDANCIAHWNGSAWSSLSTGININGTWFPYPRVRSMSLLPGGSVLVAGEFSRAGSEGAMNVAIWNGNSWTATNNGFSDVRIESLLELDNGDILVSGHFNRVDDLNTHHIARWNGAAWAPLGSGIDDYENGGAYQSVHSTIKLINNDIIAGGRFASASGVTASNIARWNGQQWGALGSGLDGPVFALLELPGGDLLVGGEFENAGSVRAKGIARWNGSAWLPVMGGVDGNAASVYALAMMPGGDIVVGGQFTSAGGVATEGVARLSGSTWSAFSPGLYGRIRALLPLPNGHLIAGGHMGIEGVAASGVVYWNGTQWAAMGDGLVGNSQSFSQGVHRLGLLPDGQVVATGEFDHSGQQSVRGVGVWGGSEWASLAAGTGLYSHALCVRRNGRIEVGGAALSGDQLISVGLASFDYQVHGIAITAHPASIVVCPGGSAQFAADTSAQDVSYQWQIEGSNPSGLYWIDLTPGTQNFGWNLDRVSVTSPFSNSTTIEIQPSGSATTFRVRCLVSNECVAMPSRVAIYSICVADFNCDHRFDIDDYLDFIAAFASGSPESDINHDAVIDLFDYLDFVNALAVGC